ncbi:MAG: 4-(cytidine 5'-diphospho)-2-C-methyl-D-erythritol kinase [Candidatus Wallbacteria bacterium]|nr:4-(cytidine 5'-diphospho)-2-C-methyl-D-erythritol kinase [Candidatus Wallbacteria bacterium]
MLMAASQRGSLAVRANAKVNLFLKVHGPLPDGLHPIEGVFATVSLADGIAVDVRPTPGISLVTEFDFDCPAAENLCVKAAAAFFERAGLRGHGCEIRLDKQVPVFSGLGGGSADAAAVLVLLNRMYDSPLGESELSELASGLGSDVPFALRGGVAMVRGTGGEVSPLPCLPRLHLVIVKPACHVSTAWAYTAFDGFPDKSGEGDLEGLVAALARDDAAGVAARLYNNFEGVVEARYPAVRLAREQILWAGALGAKLSGSGAAVYGIFSDASACRDAAGKLQGRYPAWECALRPLSVEFEVPEESRP